MSLYRPYLYCVRKPNKEGFMVQHNCDGALDFRTEEEVDDHVGRLISLALEEGRRQRSQEILALLTNTVGNSI